MVHDLVSLRPAWSRPARAVLQRNPVGKTKAKTKNTMPSGCMCVCVGGVPEIVTDKRHTADPIFTTQGLVLFRNTCAFS